MTSTTLNLRLLGRGSKRARMAFQPSGSLSIEMPAGPGAWAAISPPFSEWIDKDRHFDGPVIVQIDMEVERGIAGVHLLDAAGEPVGDPVLYRPDFLRGRLVLPLDELPPQGRLLFCNLDPSRRKTAVEIFDIALMERRPLRDFDREGVALDPRALRSAATGASVRHEVDDVHLTTPPGSGAFGAVSGQIGEWAAVHGVTIGRADLPAVLRIDVEVEAGALGLSLASHGLNLIAGNEETCHAATGTQTVWLDVGPENLDDRLLLRNASADGLCQACIKSIHIAPQPQVTPAGPRPIVLDARRLCAASAGATVQLEEGAVHVASRGAPGDWLAVSPPMDRWLAQPRLSQGLTPNDECFIELDVSVERGEARFSLQHSVPGPAEHEVEVIPAEGRRLVRLPYAGKDVSASLLIREYGPVDSGTALTVYAARLTPGRPEPDPAEALALDLYRARLSAGAAVLGWDADGSIRFETSPASGSCAFQLPPFRDWYRETSAQTGKSVAFPCVLVIEGEVTDGDVRFALTDDQHHFTGAFTEQALHASSGRRRFSFYIAEPSLLESLRIYHLAPKGRPVHGRLYSARLEPVGFSRPDMLIEGFTGRLDSGQPLFCVTHSERVTDREHSSLNFLQARYAREDGPASLPPFESLPALPADRYKGSVTLWSFEAGDWSQPRLVAALRPAFKPQHAIWYRDRLWVLGYDRIEVYDAYLHHVATITDPWLADGHTLTPDGEGCLVVACSSSDALLFVDEISLQVTRAVRMPAALYGRNYDLQRSDSVVQHFVGHDAQLTHVNNAAPWAAPPRKGLAGLWRKHHRRAVVFSTLIQGSIAYMDEDGSFGEIARGFVGCHGVRADARDGGLYFSDSTTGTIVFMDPNGGIKSRFDADSYWLHDALQLAGSDVFAVAVSDRNVVELYDVRSKRLLAAIDGHPYGEGPQFLYYGA